MWCWHLVNQVPNAIDHPLPWEETLRAAISTYTEASGICMSWWVL